ncbi:MAG: DEAD/DEAH box helicase [Planctomycetes bacterium]|nr:DEAD/DEAH box helicase [Planctomycetota bacterium]
MASLQPIHAPALRHASTQEAYDLHKAALEWSLAEPIIINSAEDIKSRVNWRERFEPYEHQVQNLITFCRRLPVTLLADDVGLGKTISAGLVLGELMYRRRISKTLVICPKILMPQWEEELQTKFGIDAYFCTGTAIKREIKRETPVLITTYDTARRHFDTLAKAGFDMLVLDEAHKLRNLYGTNNPPQIALRIRDALAKRTFKYVLMLTATPLQNRLWDLYSLVDLLTVAKGHRNPLGNPEDFADRFIEDRQDARHLVPGRAAEFRNILMSYMARTRRGDAHLLFPERQVRLHKVAPTQGELDLFSVIADTIQEMSPLIQISLAQALMSSPEALIAQMNNMAEKGTISASVVKKATQVASRIKLTAKLQGLDVLIDQLRKKREDWRLVIFTSRRETQNAIGRYLGEQGIPYGFIRGGQAQGNRKAIADIWKSPPQINVIVSTDAGAEGVNLQIANVLMNYDLPWNPMVVEQRIGRIQRLASDHANVFVVNTVLAGTVEEHVVARLMSKLQLASHAVGDVEALLESAGMEGTDDDEGSFEDQIRKLVIASLQGKNVAKATQLAEESIARAKSLIESEEETLNNVLGNLDGAHKQGPKIPELERKEPSLSCRDFVMRALRSEGGQIREYETGVYEVALPGRSPEKFTFDERMADVEEDLESGMKPLIGKVIKYFSPGQPAFERLVQSWTEKCSHRLYDLSQVATPKIEGVVNAWLGTIEKSGPIGHKVLGRSGLFRGRALLRVQASIAHDSYEKLLEVALGSPTAGDLESPDPNESFPIKEGEVSVDEMGLSLNNGGLEAILKDRDISQFCRFYEARKQEELGKAESDERKKKKLEDDFTPRVFPTLVGLTGVSFESIGLKVEFLIEGQGPYEAEIKICPSTEQVLGEPSRKSCSVSGISAPDVCMEQCAVSGQTALRHRLFRSEQSGRFALTQYSKRCARSNRILLPDEVGVSSISGAEVSCDLLIKSPVSGKCAEAHELVVCELTGDRVLPDELVVSQISGKKFRSDQQARSGLTGLVGHTTEFVVCVVTGAPIAKGEAERCEVTGKYALPSRLQVCSLTGKKAIPREVDQSAVSGKVALKQFFEKSSVSGKPFLKGEGVRSCSGKSCLPAEALPCSWSGRLAFPDELHRCHLTGLAVSMEFLTDTHKHQSQLSPLREALNGSLRGADRTDLWPQIAQVASKYLGQAVVVSAVESPSRDKLGVCVECKKWLGLKTRYAGFILEIQPEVKILGLIAYGRRERDYWIIEDSIPASKLE